MAHPLNLRRTYGEARLARLKALGTSLTDVASDLGKSLALVSRVNDAQRRSRTIEEAIAQRLGLPLSQAFPEWRR